MATNVMTLAWKIFDHFRQ